MNDFAIFIDRLHYRYGRKDVLKGLSLEVPAGTVYGFLGRNGSGKSTTIGVLMGLLRRAAGDVRVLGMDPDVDPVGLKTAVGFVAESQGFYPWMRVSEAIAFAARRRPNWDDAFAEHLRDRFGLDPKARMRELSKGQKSMTALLLALAHRPRLLILDEPTSSLDLGARRFFLEQVLGEYQEDGGTIFISSHLIHEIAGLVDHVGILGDGALIESGPLEEMQARRRRFEAIFDGDPPGGVTIPGCKDVRIAGRSLRATVDFERASEDEVRAAFDRLGAASVREETLSLEDLYLEATS